VRRATAILLVLAAAALAAPAGAGAMTVYAATSLRDAFSRIDGRPSFSFAGSDALQLQIERGAPADVFASAGPAEAQALFREGRCTRPVTFATNILVLLVPKDNPGRLRSVYSLRGGGKRLAIGTAGVPIGNYTRLLLRRLGLSSVLTSNTVSQEKDVASVSAKVALGSADAGFVYVTDAKSAGAAVKTIAIPPHLQPEVAYAGAVVKGSGSGDLAAEFLDGLIAGEGAADLKRAGFLPPP
jgi:molybdate transport system substrate-binding protein